MKSYLSLFFIGLPLFLNAQNKLSGIIKNSLNEPVIGAEIYIKEPLKGTYSNENGYFEINNLPTKIITLTISSIGYETQIKEININKEENTLNIVLNELIFKMDEIIISTPFNKLQSQNVIKVEHENIASLEQKGASTLIEGMATIPGISQISTGTSIGKPVIRGLSGNRVLVYSQGVRLENQQFGDEHGLGLNDAGIESVEVIKGPASLLYGSDAIGGVLYFNPESFADENSFKADFNQKFIANTLGSSSSLGLKTSLEKWKFLARGSFNTHSDYKIPGGERVTNSRYNETDFKTGISYYHDNFSSILRYNFNKLNIGIPEEGIEFQTDSKNLNFPKQQVFNHLWSLNSILYFKHSKLDVDLGYILNNRSEFEDSDLANLQMKLKTYSYNIKYHLPTIGKLETILGAQGMHQKNENFGEEYLIPNAVTNDFGIFGTSNYEWKSNVLQAGIRFDYREIVTDSHGISNEEGSFKAIDKNYKSFNASLGYKTNLNEKLILRLNTATGFRAPNLAELTSNGIHEGANRYEIGNSILKTEQNIQSDINLEFKSSHLEFFISGFFNHVNNYIFISPTGDIIENSNVYSYIQSNAKLYGGEIGLHFHPHPLDWLHFESTFETVTGKQQNGNYLPLIPANNLNNTLRFEFNINKWFNKGFTFLNISNTFKQLNVSGFETSSDGYSLVNFGLGGNINLKNNSFRVNINANNIFDKRYISHLSRLKTDKIPNIGRNIIIGIKFEI